MAPTKMRRLNPKSPCRTQNGILFDSTGRPWRDGRNGYWSYAKDRPGIDQRGGFRAWIPTQAGRRRMAVYAAGRRSCGGITSRSSSPASPRSRYSTAPSPFQIPIIDSYAPTTLQRILPALSVGTQGATLGAALGLLESLILTTRWPRPSGGYRARAAGAQQIPLVPRARCNEPAPSGGEAASWIQAKRSETVRPKSKTVRCPVTGKATCSQGPAFSGLLPLL